MLARVNSAAIVGIEAVAVQVEVDISRGRGAFNIVGLPDTAVKESRDRVQAAIRNSSFDFPLEVITVNLAPADIRKEGPAYDLPIALGILLATGQANVDDMDGSVLVGELSLDGSVRPIAGALPMALGTRDWGMRALVLPVDNGKEAAVVQDLNVYATATLYDTVRLLEQGFMEEPVQVLPEELQTQGVDYGVDFSEVKGQGHVKRALEVAAAGGHNCLMIGPPGSGKTMLARRMSAILPPMTLEEALEVTKLYSVAGLLPKRQALMRERPFRHPHHNVSTAGLTGGGSIPHPGEISLAHNGILFLDELPEFPGQALEVMRQPLEDGEITIARAASSLTFPARFQLIAAMNPCPCGFYTDPHRQCTCQPGHITRYLKRISGPLLDRIDMHIEVPRLLPEEVMSKQPGEPSENIRDRVIAARERQTARFADTPYHNNAQMGSKALKNFCQLSPECEQLLRAAIDQFALSARAHDRILKLARTIADLEDSDDLKIPHIAEAVQYRSMDRRLWG